MEPLAYEVRVSFGNGSTASAQGIGTVTMQVPGGPIVLLTDVLYVPGLALNLFSVKQALNRGAVIEFRDETCTICLAGKLMLKCTVTRPGNLFEFNPRYLESAHAAGVLESAELWHRRFGHLGYGNLERLVREELVDGISTPLHAFKTAGAELCEPCVMSKQHRRPFPSSDTKTTRPVELVHMDVCGAMAVTSLGGSKYLATFLDDYTGLCVVKPVPLKSDVPGAVQDVLNTLENLSGHKLRAVRTDRGGEYLNRELDRYFAGKGVLHQTTAPYTPEQNGKAERLNRTIMERVRAMLVESNLDQALWAEAAQTAAYIRNRSPTAAGDKTPYELFFGTRPDVSGMRAFGCTAYVHVPKGQRTKLDAVSLKGVFVGYEPGSKAYRVLLPERNRVAVSRDVTFNETITKPAESEAAAEPGEQRVVILDAPDADDAPAIHEEPDPADNAAEEFADALEDVEAAAEAQPPADEAPAPAQEEVPAPAGTFGNGRFPDRQRHAPRPFWQAHAAEVELTAPNTIEEALARPDAKEWIAAMNEEVAALLSKNTYTLEKLPPGMKALGVRFVFTIKRDANGNIERYKARLVVKGYLQREGVDFNEVFAPVSKHTTLRALLALVAAEDLELHQLDIKTAFLNGDLEEEVYVEQPPGFEQGGPGIVCHLKKALYGLRQAPRAWHLKLKAELAKMGFAPSEADPALFIRKQEGGNIYLLVYVDDILVAGKRLDDVTQVKKEICATFEARDMGEAHFFLGLEITRDRSARTLKLSQRRATADLVAKFGMEDCKLRDAPLPISTRLTKAEGTALDTSVYPYCELVGGLLYLSVCTRPDIAQAVGALTRYMAHPTDAHWRGAKSVLRYLASSLDVGLTFRDDGHRLYGYCDADYAGCYDTRRSTTGYVFKLMGGVVSWSSKLQPTVAVSTTEAEYMAAAHAVKEALWLRKLSSDLGVAEAKPVTIRCDNQAALSLLHNPITSARSKHIDVQYHFARERVERGEVSFTYCSTDSNVADGLTKILPGVKHAKFLQGLGLA
jgi:transposase InsO family protein